MNGAVREKLRRLARLPESRFPVISIYLDTKNDAPSKRDAVRIFLKNHVRETLSVLDGRDERASFERDAERILAFVDDEMHGAHAGEGLAIFSCAGDDVFETIPARRAFDPPQFLVSTRPLIRNLAAFLDNHDPAVAVVVDSRSARIFEISLGEAVQETGIESEVPRDHKVPEWQGFGDLKYQRDVRGHVVAHFRDVAIEMERLMHAGAYRRFVLLGQDSLISQFRASLPKRLDERVVGSGPTDRRDSRDRIVARVQEIVAGEAKRHERELVGLIRDQALSGNLGVFGLEATLNALRKGQVYRLAIGDDLRASGWRCRDCGALVTHLKRDACPHCTGPVDVVELGDEVVKDALALGAEIETVKGSAELARMGKIGALLRFRE